MVFSIAQLWRDFRLGLRNQWFMSAMVLVSIATGATCCASLVSILRGLQVQEEAIINSLGANVFAVSNAAVAKQSLLDTATVSALRTHLPELETSALRFDVIDANSTGEPLHIVQTDSGLASIQGWRMQRGRFFDPHDLTFSTRVVVVGSAFAEMSGWHPGDYLYISDLAYRIVGVIDSRDLQDQPSELGNLAFKPRTVFMPLSLDNHWSADITRNPDRVDTLIVRSKSTRASSLMAARVQRFLLGGKMLNEQLHWVTPTTLTKGIKKLRRVIGITLGSLATMLLALAATTLTASLTSSVRARFSEIGLRRSLGATRHAIAALFVMESLLISISGAALGITMTLLIGKFMTSQLGFLVEVDRHVVFIPLLIYFSMGVLASYWPAKFAANLSPALCLRQ